MDVFIKDGLRLLLDAIDCAAQAVGRTWALDERQWQRVGGRVARGKAVARAGELAQRLGQGHGPGCKKKSNCYPWPRQNRSNTQSSALYASVPYCLVLYMQVSLLFSALYASVPYCLVLYMQSVLFI